MEERGLVPRSPVDERLEPELWSRCNGREGWDSSGLVVQGSRRKHISDLLKDIQRCVMELGQAERNILFHRRAPLDDPGPQRDPLALLRQTNRRLTTRPILYPLRQIFLRHG